MVARDYLWPGWSDSYRRFESSPGLRSALSIYNTYGLLTTDRETSFPHTFCRPLTTPN